MTAAVPQKSLTGTVAEYASSTSVDSLPEEVRERGRLVIIDEIASSCFGARSAGAGLLARYAASQGGPGDCTILGTRLRAPAPLAALVNGTAGHGEEVDGAHVVGGHPGATVVAAALAVAEQQRSSGAELLNAVVLGYDIGTRLVRACGTVFGMRDRLHLHSDLLYGLGAAAAAARILGLDARRHRYALALTTFQANGLCSLFSENRHLSKSFGNGQYAAAGVSAALMAACGLEGTEDVLGAKHGLLEAWGAPGGEAAVTDALGSEFAVETANFKFVNAGYPIHAAAEAAIGVLGEHRLTADDVATIHVGMPANAMKVVDNRHMHSICVQDMVSAAVARGGLSIRNVPFPDVLEDRAYQRLRRGISVDVDADLQREHPHGRGARVTVTTTDGASVSRRVDAPRGHSARGGVSWTDLAEKWNDGLPDRDIDRILALGRDLEGVDDVTALTDAFAVR